MNLLSVSAILAWCRIHLALEGFGKVVNIGEAAQFGDVRERPIGGFKQFGSVAHSQFAQIATRGRMEGLAKKVVKPRGRKLRTARHFFD